MYTIEICCNNRDVNFLLAVDRFDLKEFASVLDTQKKVTNEVRQCLPGFFC